MLETAVNIIFYNSTNRLTGITPAKKSITDTENDCFCDLRMEKKRIKDNNNNKSLFSKSLSFTKLHWPAGSYGANLGGPVNLLVGNV